MKKRTAIVYHFFPHYRAAIFKTLARCVSREFVFVGSRTDPLDSIKPWDIPGDVGFIETPTWRIKGQSIWQGKLLRLALNREFDSIIYLANPYWPATWLSSMLARLTGKRVLFWTHGWKRRDKGIVRLLRDAYHRIAHGLLLYGYGAKMIGLEEGFPPERLYVIYNSLDYDEQCRIRQATTPARLAAAKAELFGGSATPIAICVCRLIPQRRLDMLVDALALLATQGHRVNLVLVGDGPERASLEARARAAGLHAHFSGACYSEERLAELFMASNVTVAPSQLGLTAMHSLAFGTPVITNDDWEDQGPEFEAVIPGQTGDLYPRGNVPALAEAIRRWTIIDQVPEATRTNCIRIVERFYNSNMQLCAIMRALEGEPADDLFWQRQPECSIDARMDSGR